MKKNPLNRWGDVGDLMLLAEMLHSVIKGRGKGFVVRNSPKGMEDVNPDWEKSFGRMLAVMNADTAKSKALLKDGLVSMKQIIKNNK